MKGTTSIAVLASVAFAAWLAGAPTPLPPAQPATSPPASMPPPRAPGAKVQRTNASFAILNGRLEAEPADIVRLTVDAAGVGELVVRDAGGALKTRPLSDIIAIVSEPWITDSDADSRSNGQPQAVVPMLELTDGQRWPGSFALELPPEARLAAGTDPPVRWSHLHLENLRVPIDLVRRYAGAPALAAQPAGQPVDRPGDARPTARPASPKAEADSVLLTNGDRIGGVIEHIGQTVQIAPAGGGGARAGASTTIAIGQVVEARLANPSVRPRGPTVWLIDATVARVASIAMPNRAQLSIRAAAQAPDMSAESEAPVEHGGIDRATPSGETAPGAGIYLLPDLVAFAPDASRILALHDLPIGEVRPVEPFIFAESVRIRPPAGGIAPLDAADIVLPGPMSVRWSLPAGSRSMAFTAALDDDTAVWSDCTLRVKLESQGGPARELARAGLSAESRSQSLGADIGGSRPGDAIVMILEPGKRGPIQNRVAIRHAVILLDKQSK